MQRRMELERTGPGILDTQLQFKRSAAYQYSQLAGERVGPKSARLVGVFDANVARASRSQMSLLTTRQSQVRTKPWWGRGPYVANCGNTTGTPPRIGERPSNALCGLRKSRS